MRKVLCFTLLVVLMAGLSGCGSDEPSVITPASITLGSGVSSEIAFDTSGGTKTVTFAASDPWEARVTGDDADLWCEVSPTSGPAGNGSVSITVKQNDGYNERLATIKLKCGSASCSVNVTQKQKDALGFTHMKDYVVSSKAQNLRIWIDSNVPVSAMIQDGCDWISEVPTKTYSANSFDFSISKNDAYDGRSADIKFVNAASGLSITACVTQMQQDAIVLAREDYYIGTDGGQLDLEVDTNNELSVEIPLDARQWIKSLQTKGLHTEILSFSISPTNDNNDRSSAITIKAGDAVQKITISQEGLAKSVEREALIALYNATKGNNWKNNTNWCSDKPVGEWYGVTTGWGGRIIYLELTDNDLSGILPADIYQLGELRHLILNQNEKLKGALTSDIARLSHLVKLNLSKTDVKGIPPEMAELADLGSLHINVAGQIPPALRQLKNLSVLRLTGATGTIPAWLGDMSGLVSLFLTDGELSGSIPPELGKLTELVELNLGGNNLTGEIPPELGNLKRLTSLCLVDNRLSGAIPSSFNNLTRLESMPYLYRNQLSGDIPELFLNMDWTTNWQFVMRENRYSFDDVYTRAPSFSLVDIDGVHYSSDAEYAKHKLTALLVWGTWCGFSNAYMPLLKEAYERYKDDGFEILGQAVYEEGVDHVRQYIESHGIEWPNIIPSISNCVEGSWMLGSAYAYPTSETPSLIIVDNEGRIRFSSLVTNRNELLTFLEESLGPATHDKYVSTDFSQNGAVQQLQQATEGSGIDIILMGDAFSDRMIARGEYDRIMNQMMEALFSEEPYKSFRHLFNVYSVVAVSANEDYFEGMKTAFNTYHRDGSTVGGDDDKVIEYAMKAVGSKRVNSATIAVAMNSMREGGTCYMNCIPDNDFGAGLSISYIPVSDGGSAFEGTVRHEAGGHGFAKLADEYDYDEYGAIPEDKKRDAQAMAAYGWYKNIDFTSDPMAVKWSRFITDARYASERIGVFEGGMTYNFGVWRPTECSIMRYNEAGYNAPSREAIYYSIHKNAYGKEWEYKYEDFVTYDAVNRNKLSSRKSYQTQGTKQGAKRKQPAPPVFKGFLDK